MPEKTWNNYYINHKPRISNIVLHFQYLLKIIFSRPKTILEIGCGPADHSMFIKKIFNKIKISLLDTDKSLLERNKKNYSKKILQTYNYDILDHQSISTLPKFDVVMSQGLMEHFEDADFLKIIHNFSHKTKKMIFSIPSDIYQNQDFGNEILRSKSGVESLLRKGIDFPFKVINYFDIGVRTKLNIIKQNKLSFINALKFFLSKSCHLLVEISFEEKKNGINGNIFSKIYKHIFDFLINSKIKDWYVLKCFNKIIFYFIKKDFITLYGQKFFLDSEDSLRLSVDGVFEPFETELFKKEVRSGDTILDVGANIGYYTVLFAKLVGDTGHVYAFEPDPSNFSILKKNITSGGYKNVTLIQKAVSNVNEEIKLFLSDKNKGDHRIYDSHDGRHFISISAITLDEYFKDYDGNIDFIKMDIQGSEGIALLGMKNILEKNNIKIVSEFWPTGLIKQGTKPKDYVDLLIGLKYKIYEIDEDLNQLKSLDFSELEKRYLKISDEHTNFLCIKEDVLR